MLKHRKSVKSLVSYANFPSTEYLTIDFTDFLCLVIPVYVETQEIGEIYRQGLMPREIGLADQRTRTTPAYQRYQLLQEAPYLLCPVPADHVRRDLIADEIGKYRRMPAAGAHAAYDCLSDLRLDRRAVEERDVLRPGQSDENLKPGFLRGI